MLRSRGLWLSTLLVVLAAPLPAAALTYPGAAPCDTTLQACITGAAPGDIIEIATDGPIDETLAIGKSLTLGAAAGFSPVIGGGATLRDVSLDNLGSLGDSQVVLIEDLSFVRAQITGLISQGQFHTVTVQDCTFFLELDHNNTPALEIDARVPLSGFLQRNRITATGQGIRLWAILDSGEVLYRVENNFITTSLPAESNAGIQLDFRGTGAYEAGVRSNVVHGVGGCNCGGNGGITADLIGSPLVLLHFINNTVHGRWRSCR